tara:strand:+ start:4852 stop:5037 length:186 start_codon:yes stop_codon:yes gene_type:complete
MLKSCNINKTDRINRAVIGVLIVLGALFGFSRTAFIILGVVLIIEGLIGWCSIPFILNKFK